MACDQTGWTFHEAELGKSDVRGLLALHFAEMRRTSPPDACHVMPAEALASPDIRFFSLRDGAGRLMGVGALKTLDSHHGEIKSMRVAEAALGCGAGRCILDRLLRCARESGMVRVSLETGNHPLFDPARTLYERSGFRPSAAFGGYEASPFTLFFTRDLAS